jgi:type I restriction enzyme, S subunit
MKSKLREELIFGQPESIPYVNAHVGAHDKWRAFVLMTVSSDGFVAVTAQTMKEGSKMPRADWKQMQQYIVSLPPEGLQAVFNSIIDPILQQLKTLSFENRNLSKARDILLPRLMSGEVVV